MRYFFEITYIFRDSTTLRPTIYPRADGNAQIEIKNMTLSVLNLHPNVKIAVRNSNLSHKNTYQEPEALPLYCTLYDLVPYARFYSSLPGF